MVCDGRLVCIIQNIRGEVVKISDVSGYMPLDLNIQSFGSSINVMQSASRIKQVNNRAIMMRNNKVLSCSC